MGIERDVPRVVTYLPSNCLGVDPGASVHLKLTLSPEKGPNSCPDSIYEEEGQLSTPVRVKQPLLLAPLMCPSGLGPTSQLVYKVRVQCELEQK